MHSPNGRRSGSPSRKWTWPNTTPRSGCSPSKASCGGRRRWAAHTAWTAYRPWPCRAATSSSRAHRAKRCSPPPTFSSAKAESNSQKQNPRVAAVAPRRMKPRGRLEKWLLAWAFALLAGAASAQIQLGREFQRVEPPHPTTAGNRVEVIEFFYYGCPLCYETEPFFSRWLGTVPESVALRRVPALSTEAWGPLAKLFYTLDALGQIGRLHCPVDDSFHFEDVRLNDEKIIADWAGRNGIDRPRFLGTYASPEGAAKARPAAALLSAYGVAGRPPVILEPTLRT